MEASNYFKPSIIDLKPYTSARDEYNSNAKVFMDANENAFATEFNRYPDPYQTELKKEIGRWRKVDPSNIFLGNGSDEIIDLLIRSTCVAGRDRILALDPSYGMYQVSSSINEVELEMLSLDVDMKVNAEELMAKGQEDYKLIFLCSPNNPDGGTIDSEIISSLLNRTRALVVIDEAYIDFSSSESWLSKLSQYENLIVLQTFSKSLGAAALRIGMAFMHSDLIYYLNKIKPPYNISEPNQKAALQKLSNFQDILNSIVLIKEQREWLRQRLNQLDIVEFIFPSEANFLLVKFRNVKTVFYYLRSVGIIVRDRSRQRNCEGCLRITVGTASENRILIEGLNVINSKIAITV